MSQASTTQEFAFGDNTVNGRPCPVLAATGEKPDGFLLEVAEQYDEECLDQTGRPEGVLDAQTAEELWNKAIESYRRFTRDAYGREEQEALQSVIEEAEHIASEAF